MRRYLTYALILVMFTSVVWGCGSIDNDPFESSSSSSDKTSPHRDCTDTRGDSTTGGSEAPGTPSGDGNDNSTSPPRQDGGSSSDPEDETLEDRKRRAKKSSKDESAAQSVAQTETVKRRKPNKQDLIMVPESLYQGIIDLPKGSSYETLSNKPGYHRFRDEFFGDFPESGAPNAVCTDVVAPIENEDSCIDLSPNLIDSGSFDPDAPEKFRNRNGDGLNPSEARLMRLRRLNAQLDKQQVCGLGPHKVQLQLTDPDGKDSFCNSNVELCNPDDSSCPNETTREDPPPVQDPWRSVGTVRCKWVASFVSSPKKKKPIKSWKISGATWEYVFNGKGPYHFMNVGESSSRNCLSDKFSSSWSKGGDVTLNVSLVCSNRNREKYECQNTCGCGVEIQGSYTSRVRAHSNSGLMCPPLSGSNNVEALAQDEARLKVNGSTVFNKAVAVQNGNAVSKSISFELGASSENGASGKFGASKTIKDSTGTDSDQLDVFGGTRVQCPVTARLKSKGRVDVEVENRSWGNAQSDTEAWLLYYVAKSNCPGAGWKSGYRTFYSTDYDGYAQDVEAANQFFESRGVDLRISSPSSEN